MHIHYAVVEEQVRRHHDPLRPTRRHHPTGTPLATRSRVAGALRRAADRLEH